MPTSRNVDAPAVGAPLVQVQQVADPRVGVGEPLRGPGDGAVHVGVPGDEQVGPAVAVDVTDGRPRVPADGRGAGGLGPLGEGSVALVPQERAGLHARHVQIRVAVEIEVRRHAAVAADGEIGAGAGADVDEGALDVVVQGAPGQPARLFPPADLLFGVRVDRIEVEPAVAVVVEPADPRPRHRRRVGRDLPPKRTLPEVDPDLAGDVGELDPRRPVARREGRGRWACSHRHSPGPRTPTSRRRRSDRGRAPTPVRRSALTPLREPPGGASTASRRGPRRAGPGR